MRQVYTFVHEQEAGVVVRPIMIGQRRWRHGVDGDVVTGGRIEQTFSLILGTQAERVRPPLTVVVVVVVVVVIVGNSVVVAAVNYDNSAAVVRRRLLVSGSQPRRLYQP